MLVNVPTRFSYSEYFVHLSFPVHFDPKVVQWDLHVPEGQHMWAVERINCGSVPETEELYPLPMLSHSAPLSLLSSSLMLCGMRTHIILWCFSSPKHHKTSLSHHLVPATCPDCYAMFCSLRLFSLWIRLHLVYRTLYSETDLKNCQRSVMTFLVLGHICKLHGHGF